MEGLWSRRRIVFSGALCVLVAVLAVVITVPRWHVGARTSAGRPATATAPAPTATWRPTYSIVPEGPVTKIFHRGDKLAYGWDSTLDSAPKSYAPGTYTCTFALYGPYPSETDAEHASPTDFAKATPAVAVPPLTLDRWTSASHPEALSLPQNLALGYYVALGRVVESDGPAIERNATSTDIISIVT